MKTLLFFLIIFTGIMLQAAAQDTEHKSSTLWHQKERSIRYIPDHGDFVIHNGGRRFNRALYGTNTAFRVETGDLPEFAFYMPGMGGNLKPGLMAGSRSIWLTNAQNIYSRYRPGSIIYEITDPILGKGKITLTVLALANAEGMILKTEFQNIPDSLEMLWAYGGASGKKFSRDGDLNVDPESVFYLKPENCSDNNFTIRNNTFHLVYGSGKILSEEERYENQDQNKADQKEGTGKNQSKQLRGTFPDDAVLKMADAKKQENPFIYDQSVAGDSPSLAARFMVKPGKPYYILMLNPLSIKNISYAGAAEIFEEAEIAREKLANRIKIETPDEYINNLGATLGIAADAIWEYPTYLHGAIGWRMRLNGWRGPYTADPLGWHNRAATHIRAYAKSQITSPDSGPSVPDPEKNLARQQEKTGNALYTSGYICRNPDGDIRPHHYDMNLVFIDNMLRHFLWTGNLAFVKEMWPVLSRHLAWEKRNFDGDGDGLYDAYCCIWASDALEYESGGVTHSSAYNYLANKMAAHLAPLIGEDPEPYRKEAGKILHAMNQYLWMPQNGSFAEYKDFLGLKRLHPAAALWTVYHTIDSEVPDAFQAYEMTRYVDTQIPHIPVLAKGLPDKGYYMLSTTNWMPYEWSVNNVVMAENLHTALAFWQSGRADDAFLLWKSTLLDAMYLGSSPGNFTQLSFYDAARGEAYRDFADEIGMTARTLVEGLFGIVPNAIDGFVTIKPGFPDSWDHASLTIPDITFTYRKNGRTDHYTLNQNFPIPLKVRFRIKARGNSVKSLTINDQQVSWNNVNDAIGSPEIEFTGPSSQPLQVSVTWQGPLTQKIQPQETFAGNRYFSASVAPNQIFGLYDPQKIFKKTAFKKQSLFAEIGDQQGEKTAFVKITNGSFTWWMPIEVNIQKPVEIVSPLDQPSDSLLFNIRNNTDSPINISIRLNSGEKPYAQSLQLNAHTTSPVIRLSAKYLVTGSNPVEIVPENFPSYTQNLINWNIRSNEGAKYETVNLSAFINDKVTQIFRNKYLSPRSPYPTLAIPIQGIGDWCSPLKKVNIDDEGLRKRCGNEDTIIMPQGIPFSSPGNPEKNNIIFSTLWDNYPNSCVIPLTGQATHAYFLMAGSTNPMQSRFENGVVRITYTDGTIDSLALVNPETWWPIDQDYNTDGFAFYLKAPAPPRLYLKSGRISIPGTKAGKANIPVDGGAATILDLPLNKNKILKQVSVVTLANETIIGLMGITLVR